MSNNGQDKAFNIKINGFNAVVITSKLPLSKDAEARMIKEIDRIKNIPTSSPTPSLNQATRSKNRNLTTE